VQLNMPAKAQNWVHFGGGVPKRGRARAAFLRAASQKGAGKKIVRVVWVARKVENEHARGRKEGNNHSLSA